MCIRDRAWTIILTGLEVAICFAVVTRLSLPTAEVATPALAISFAHFFVGLTCIISQRNILKQIFGYCLMAVSYTHLDQVWAEGEVERQYTELKQALVDAAAPQDVEPGAAKFDDETHVNQIV